ncbi:MAG: TetR/AcrR family transcriptional regulator [Clostridiales Family XIII bacterium]|jgi:AcrR family transcriptional regulator|nr:TetR/AcrR family transcriptional regulator [Clostridiales Family XIII bacterium]
MSKRDDILRATLHIVAREGIQSLTLSKIQKEAGVGSGTLYNYFFSKEELLVVLYKDTMDRMNSYLLDGLDTGCEVRVVFDTFVSRLLDYSIRYYDEFNFTEQYSFFMRDGQHTDEAMRIGAFFDVAIELFRRGQAQRIIKDLSATLLSRVVSGIIIAVAKSCYLKDLHLGKADRKAVVDTCWDAVKA